MALIDFKLHPANRLPSLSMFQLAAAPSPCSLATSVSPPATSARGRGPLVPCCERLRLRERAFEPLTANQPCQPHSHGLPRHGHSIHCLLSLLWLQPVGFCQVCPCLGGMALLTGSAGWGCSDPYAHPAWLPFPSSSGFTGYQGSHLSLHSSVCLIFMQSQEKLLFETIRAEAQVGKLCSLLY